MSFFEKIIAAGKEKVAKAFNTTYGTGLATAFPKLATIARNSAFEATPETVEMAHQGVQNSTDFLRNHVDVELVESESGKYLGIYDDSQPFSTQESLQDSEEDTTFTEAVPYQTTVICARIPIPYAFIVRWYHIKNFLALVLNALGVSKGSGYVRLGFWGQYRKANTLAQDEPLGKRIIKGWLDWLINNGDGQVKGIILGSGDTTGTIRSDRRDYKVDPINIGTATGTKGSGSAYTSNTAGYAVGATAVTLITGSGTVVVGEEIQFTGDDTRYTITTGVSAPGVISFTPGLKVAIPASATAMSIVTETVADYADLDTPVLDAIQTLIPIKFRKNLRIVVGQGIHNYLNKNAVSILTTSKAQGVGITEMNAMSEYSMKMNIAGFPVVLDETAPDNMLLVTRTSQSSASWAAMMNLAASGITTNPLLSNSNLVLLRHVKVWRAMMDLAFKSKIVDFSWESVFYGMRHHQAAVLFHPDSIRFFNGTTYKGAAVQWQLTKYDQAILD